jgi:hypothetical protein
MIRTPTNGKGLVADNSMLQMLSNSLTDGILYRYDDIEDQLQVLKAFWGKVAQVFSADWGLQPKKSRLLHGVGIIALGFVMDTLAERNKSKKDLGIIFLDGLRKIAKECKWSSGEWHLGVGYTLKWNEVQNVPRHIQLIANHILSILAKS